MKKLIFIIPFFNIEKNINSLVLSLKSQTNDNFKAVFIDDLSEDNSFNLLKEKTKDDNRFKLIKNSQKKYALKNVIETARKYQETNNICTVLDGDDSLCNNDTVQLFLEAYENGSQIVWSKHQWQPRGGNISAPMSDLVNPYDYPWVSSHLKSWKAKTLSNIKDENFQFADGSWFERGYDCALYLPMLFIEKKGRKLIDEVCYTYNLDSCSIPLNKRNYNEQVQLRNVRFIRSRGFVK